MQSSRMQQHTKRKNYRFEVDNTSEANPIDWYKAYLEMEFQLVQLADSDAGIAVDPAATANKCTTTNGQTFIKKIEVECNGITVYNNTRANEVVNVLSMLKYTKSYADTVGKDQFFFVDSKTGAAQPNPAPAAAATYNEGFAKRKVLTDAAAVNNISIPLNLYSYFAAFKNNLHPNLKTTILLTLENDNNIVFRHADAAPSKVIITKLRLWAPKIIFNDTSLKTYLDDYQQPKTWTYHKEHHEIKQSNATNDAFRISSGIRKPRHVYLFYSELSRVLFLISELKRFKISDNDECFFCKSPDSLEHAFLECPAGLKLFQESLTWFNDKHKVNFTPSKLQLLFKDYDPPPKTNSNITRKFLILTVQTQKYYYTCKMLENIPNIPELKSALLLQWKVEKCEI